nr:CAP domain-containing protein [Deinobacterium chartae]
MIGLTACGAQTPLGEPAPSGSEASGSAPIQQTPTFGSASSFEAQVLSLTNAARARGATCGGVAYPPVPALTANAQLRQAAYLHAKDMGDNNYFDHVGRNGRMPWDRMRAAGYIGRTYGENIAAGQSTPQQVVDGWLKSSGHCRNIMSRNFKDLGVGYYYRAGSNFRHYWVQNFGAK